MQRILTAAVVLLFGSVLNAQTTPIYNSIPSPLPPSLTSQNFQAARISEFGNLVKFGGTNRHLTSVTVAMVTWGYFSKYNTADTPNNGSWSHNITLNLYSVNNGNPNVPGTLIQSCHAAVPHSLAAGTLARLRAEPVEGFRRLSQRHGVQYHLRLK